MGVKPETTKNVDTTVSAGTQPSTKEETTVSGQTDPSTASGATDASTVSGATDASTASGATDASTVSGATDGTTQGNGAVSNVGSGMFFVMCSTVLLFIF